MNGQQTPVPRGAGEAIAAAAGEADPAVRQTALLALGRFLGDKHRPVVEAGTRDAEPAVRAIQGDDSPAVRLRAMHTLGVRFGFTFSDSADPRTPEQKAKIDNTLKMLPDVTEALEKYPPVQAPGGVE